MGKQLSTDTIKQMQERSKRKYGRIKEPTPIERKMFISKAVVPDLPKTITRPQAIYNNLPTPYGIATEMLNAQLKKSG